MAPMFQESPVASAVNGSANSTLKDHPFGLRESFARTVASHPTRSLQFLAGLDEQETKEPLQAKIKLQVIVVGGGLGGLACAIALSRRGHTVTVLEQTVQLGEVGAGIQIPPNSARLLNSWGLGPYLEPYVVEPNGMNFRRWDTGEVIGFTKLVPDFRDNFKAPYYVIHRAHFHDALQKRALELGVDVRVNSKVVDYDLEAPSIELENGQVLHADLVVAADGVKSTARKLILGGTDAGPEPTGFVAYRATVNVEKIKADSEIAWLLEKPTLNIWIGEDRHVMTYTIAAGKSFNMVLSHVDTTAPSTWKASDALRDMRAYFAGWDARLTTIIGLIEQTTKWPLVSAAARVARWVAAGDKVLMLGDAAHAMVPYMSQGAAMAVEDGAALAAVLSLVGGADEVPRALRVWEGERMRRTGQMRDASLLNGRLWHFKDGPEQRRRDRGMRPEVEGRSFSWSPNQWSDPVTQWWAYGYDAEEEVERAFRERVLAVGTSTL